MENWHHPKESISADDYQIEHIMPQTIDDEHGWKESLGENWEDVHDRLCNNLGKSYADGLQPGALKPVVLGQAQSA